VTTSRGKGWIVPKGSVDDGERPRDYEVTLDDPRTWRGPWTAALDIRRQAAGLFEYACHEGNYGPLNMLATSRVAEKSKK
jgi:hypothetical protein